MLRADLDTIAHDLEGKSTFLEVVPADRWDVRSTIYRFRQNLGQANLPPAAFSAIAPYRRAFSHSIEYVPFWVIVGVALALGAGTTIGYKRIVVTVAEKIGKTHMTYAQGAAAEVIAAATIGLADIAHMPVSTTHVLASGIAGTMWANRSGIQGDTVKKIGLAWILTLPAAILISAALFTFGGYVVPGASARDQCRARPRAWRRTQSRRPMWTADDPRSRLDVLTTPGSRRAGQTGRGAAIVCARGSAALEANGRVRRRSSSGALPKWRRRETI